MHFYGIISLRIILESTIKNTKMIHCFFTLKNTKIPLKKLSYYKGKIIKVFNLGARFLYFLSTNHWTFFVLFMGISVYYLSVYYLWGRGCIFYCRFLYDPYFTGAN
jgi:hypothetical protein